MRKKIEFNGFYCSNMASLLHYICVAFLLTPSVLCVALRNDSYGDNFYVSSNRKGCVTVKSQQPCPARTLNPDIAVAYKYDAEMIESMIEDTKINNASDECISALTKTLCSTLTPRCFVNGSRDYGNARAACWKANKTCPSDSLEEGECESLKTGLHQFSACVKPSKPINGSCPQPKYKMPADKLDLYKRSSEEYAKISYFKNLTTARFPNGTRMFSAQCVSNIKELYCLPFYCSADEQQIIVEYTYEDCQDIIYDCFEPVIDQLSGDEKEDIIDLEDKYGDNCIFYPVAEPSPDSGIPSENTTSTPSGQNVSSTTPTEQMTSTTPGQNVSSTPSSLNVSSTTPTEKVTSTTPGQNVSSTPSSLNVSSTTPTEKVTSTPPGQNVSSTPRSLNVSSTTPRQNLSTTPPEKTESSSAPTDSKQSTPSEITTSFLLTPSPTGGTVRCKNFPPLLLLFLLVLLQIN